MRVKYGSYVVLRWLRLNPLLRLAKIEKYLTCKLIESYNICAKHVQIVETCTACEEERKRSVS